MRRPRRMRERYGARRAALQREVERTLGGTLRLPAIEAGLSTPAYLPRATPVSAVVERGLREGIEL